MNVENTKLVISTSVMDFMVGFGIFPQEGFHSCLMFVVIPCPSMTGLHHLKFWENLCKIS